LDFCSPFDAALARSGPGAVFLRDPEGTWRFDASWTRDGWERAAGDDLDPAFFLLRDRLTGFVSLAWTSRAALLASHPRADVRRFASLVEAEAERSRHGSPPVSRRAWS
jgi:hypothetical protein